jgi:hypothetical protein
MGPMIPEEIIQEYGNLARSALDKQVRWKPGDHQDRAPRWDWATGKLLEIIRVQDEELDELRARVEALEARA